MAAIFGSSIVTKNIACIALLNLYFVEDLNQQ